MILVVLFARIFILQVLSISELQQLAAPQLNSTSLELRTAMHSWEIPGIAHLLNSFSDLERLSVRLDEKLLLGNWEEAARVRFSALASFGEHSRLK